jgi:tRNA (cmo5U34)-methyltransferase
VNFPGITEMKQIFIYLSAVNLLKLQNLSMPISLLQNGCFVHYDVVVPVSTKIENWFLSLWNQWIKEHPNKAMSEKLLGIPGQYKKNTDNQPDTLGSQLQALTQIGFKEVDCFFKHGIFSLFGGFK